MVYIPTCTIILNKLETGLKKKNELQKGRLDVQFKVTLTHHQSSEIC